MIEDNAYEHENERKNYEKRQTKIVIQLHIKKKHFCLLQHYLCVTYRLFIPACPCFHRTMNHFSLQTPLQSLRRIQNNQIHSPEMSSNHFSIREMSIPLISSPSTHRVTFTINYNSSFREQSLMKTDFFTTVTYSMSQICYLYSLCTCHLLSSYSIHTQDGQMH